MKIYKIGTFLILTLVVIFVISFYIRLKINDNQKDIIEIERISSFDNPIIPDGFKKIETDLASWREEKGIPIGWNKGLVIEDEKGNQFVWVPVDLNNLSYDSYYVAQELQYQRNLLDIENAEELQILKYGGFYVARYEAGISRTISDDIELINVDNNNSVGIPTSQKGSIPWNYINLENAEKSARSMYDLNGIKSKLLTERQWQAIMQWLNGNGYDVYNSSTNWGNYSNVNFSFTGYYSENNGKSYKYAEKKAKEKYNIILSCGATDRNMANNIYDLAGNLREYVTDSFSQNYKIAGGYYDYIGQGAYVVGPNYSQPSSQIGFRVALLFS